MSWALRLDIAWGEAAAALRQRAGVAGCLVDDELWLRGEAMDEGLERALRKTGGERFTIGEGGRTLTRVDELIPCGRLPDEPWVALATLLEVAAPTAALSGLTQDRLELRLVRGGAERLANVLITTLAEWVEFAMSAAEVRLRPLRFAATQDGRCLIHGTPLPPIAGTRFVELAGVALPCGFELEPPVGGAVVASAIGLEPGDVAAFDESGAYERVPAGAFVRARRSAARLTARKLAASAGREP
jgi:hypothetical protein